MSKMHPKKKTWRGIDTHCFAFAMRVKQEAQSRGLAANIFHVPGARSTHIEVFCTQPQLSSVKLAAMRSLMPPAPLFFDDYSSRVYFA